MKLEVGMYVRLKKGVIERIRGFKPITKYTKYNTLYFENILGECLFTNEELKEFKASHNIIDLIEVGDYVNGSKVVNINYDLNYDEDIVESITIFDYSIEGNDILHNEDIKSIVTKEQFESMSYKLGDNNE